MKDREPAPTTRPPAPVRQRRAFSTFGGPVELGGDGPASRALGQLFAVDEGLARALTHGFHSYAGRMHPTIARGAVAAYSAPGELVVDPFCGSGTVLVEAFGLGRRGVGVDASPLGIAIAKARTTLLGAEGRARLEAEATSISEQAGERARKRKRPELPEWARGELTRFHPHVLFELLGVRELVLATKNDDVGHALRLCLSSILVKFMKAGPEAPRDGADKRIARGVPSRMLADRALELSRGLAALEARAPAGTPSPRVVLGDARALDAVKAGEASLVLSSPPYAGTYDYAALHDVRFRWLELPRSAFREAQLGARSGGGVSASAWREAQQQWLGEISRVLRPGGHALLVVGDGILGGQPEDAPDSIADVAIPLGLEPVARASQGRPVHDTRVRDVFGDRPRREHLLLLRRTDKLFSPRPRPGNDGPPRGRPAPRGPARPSSNRPADSGAPRPPAGRPPEHAPRPASNRPGEHRSPRPASHRPEEHRSPRPPSNRPGEHRSPRPPSNRPGGHGPARSPSGRPPSARTPRR